MFGNIATKANLLYQGKNLNQLHLIDFYPDCMQRKTVKLRQKPVIVYTSFQSFSF